MTTRSDREMELHTRELYDRYPFGDFCYGPEREQHNAPLAAFLRSIGRKGTVCDIGCGSGYWSEAAVHAGVEQDRILALDVTLRNLASLRGKGFRAVCGNALSLPLQSDAMDFTFCNGVIHHTSDPRQAFRELVRITKPGGRLFVAVYERWNPYFYLVHRATAPFRYAYWHWDRRVLDWVFPAAQIVFQPLAYLVMGRSLDRQTGWTMLADNVLSPYAHLLTKRTVRRWAAESGCTILRFGYSGLRLMLTAEMRVDKSRPVQ